MTDRIADITKALNEGAKVVVGLNTYKGAEDVAKFLAKFEDDVEYLGYQQVRFFYPGVKYRTYYRAAH